MRRLSAITGGRAKGLTLGLIDDPTFGRYNEYYGPWASSSTWGPNREDIASSFEGYIEGVYKRNGIVFACIQARALPFSEARFQYQQFNNGRPGDLFGTPDLALLERPWPNGTTGELLQRMEQDASLAGNFYATTVGTGGNRRIRRMRADWVTIVSGVAGDPEASPYELDADVLGYIYAPPPTGSRRDVKPTLLTPDRVVHYSPIPDPDAQWRGMSWLTPVLREIQADTATTRHKQKFFENGATINIAIKYDASLTLQQVKEFAALFAEAHQGTENAYKALHMGGGGDPTTIGSSLKDLDFKAVQGAGEPLALDTPIPTPSGWSTMGALVPGDLVFGRGGLPARVLAVSPVHIGRKCYRVTFNDHTSIVADGGHLWTAMDRNTKRRSEQDYTTEELRDLIEAWGDHHQANRIAVSQPQAAKLPDVDLLVDPYVLGAWLGDGQTAGAAICGADADLVFIAAEIEQRGYTVSRWKPQPDKVATIGLPGGLLAALRSLDVLGNKHIPDNYMRSSIEQRTDLLRGLMDTDGTVGLRGRETCEFSSKYEALARQVVELVRSLGQRATLTVKFDERSRTGETWRVTFRADPDRVPFLLPRKVARCMTPLHVRNRAIVSIDAVESVPVRCITVDTADHLFLAGDGWVPTHNTRIAAAAGVGAIIARFSEGLQGSALNQGNYAAAKRQFSDMLLRPNWRMASASLEKFAAPLPGGARLWYDARDVAFLAEDQKDAAEILASKAMTVRQLIDAGYDPDAAIRAVQNDDLSLLVGNHSGLYSVQLQPAGSQPTPTPTPGGQP